MSHTDITEDTDVSLTRLCCLRLNEHKSSEYHEFLSLGSSARKKNQQINLGVNKLSYGI